MAKKDNDESGGAKTLEAPATPAPQASESPRAAGSRAAFQDELDAAAEFDRKIRRPKLGEPVIYVLGDNSPNKGEFRAGVISRVCAEDPKFPGQANVTFYIARNNDPANGKAALPMYFAEGTVYDESGKPGTWHYRGDCGEADNGWE